jgi:hypothetical protein
MKTKEWVMVFIAIFVGIWLSNNVSFIKGIVG